MVGAACASLIVLASHGSAQTKTALTGRESIDLVTGPVLGSGRVVGLGGAYAALAVGADGAAWTPAAYGTRVLWDLDWFGYDVALDYSPAVFRNLLFEGLADSGLLSSASLAAVGARMVFGSLGVGALLREQYYNVGGGANLRLSLANVGAAYAFMEGQLVIGMGVRTATMSVTGLAPERRSIDFFGMGPEAGAVLGPVGQHYRIGASARLSVRAGHGGGAPAVSTLTLPSGLVLPAEVQLGFAYQFGPRPLNRRFVDPHLVNKELLGAMLDDRAERMREELRREQAEGRAPDGEPTDVVWWGEEARTREREERELAEAMRAAVKQREDAVKQLSRTYLLLSAEAIFVAAIDNGIGIESFLMQQSRASGRHPTVGLRAGAEGEPVPGWMILRLGSYLEPSRFAGVGYRVHATIGSDVRMFSWDLFGLVDEFTLRVGAYGDVASRYQAIGFSVGMWH